MAGTATRYNQVAVPMGVVAQLRANLSVPAASARLPLDADGTPDATANPSAKHLGHTDAGLTVTARETIQDYFADEVPYPIGSSVESAEVMIEGAALQIADEEAMKIFGSQIGTYSTNTGYKQFTLGYKPTITYNSMAVIFPSPLDPTKFS